MTRTYKITVGVSVLILASTLWRCSPVGPSFFKSRGASSDSFSGQEAASSQIGPEAPSVFAIQPRVFTFKSAELRDLLDNESSDTRAVFSVDSLREAHAHFRDGGGFKFKLEGAAPTSVRAYIETRSTEIALPIHLVLERVDPRSGLWELRMVIPRPGASQRTTETRSALERFRESTDALILVSDQKLEIKAETIQPLASDPVGGKKSL